MKLKSSIPLAFIGLFSLASVNASIPSTEEIQQIQSRVQSLKENPDSDANVDALFEDIESITQKHGIEGVSWVAYE